MNIEEYRAMVAQQQQEQTTPPETTPVEVVETAQQADAGAEPPVTQEQTTPDSVEIDGHTYTLEELKGGILRQSDYTVKTQELAREKERLSLAQKYFEAVNSKPEFAKEIAESFNLPYVSPDEQRFNDLNAQYQETLLRQEIAMLETKHTDFNADKVVAFSLEKGMDNLEDAYFLMKAKASETPAATDIAALTEQIRQSVLNDLKSTVDTSSTILSGGDAASITQTMPELSAQEQRVAKGLKMTNEEYLLFKQNRK